MYHAIRLITLIPFLLLTTNAYSYCELVYVITSGRSDSRILSFSDDPSGCANATTGSIGSGAESDYINDQISKGRSVAKIFGVDEYKDAGGAVVAGIKAIFAGPQLPTDTEGARQQARLMDALNKALQQYQDEIIQDLQKRNDNVQKIIVKTQIEIKEWNDSIAQSKKAAIEALLNAQNQSAMSAGSLTISSEAFELSQSALNVSMEKFEQLKQGALTPEALDVLKNSVQKDIDNFANSRKLDQLNGLLSLIANEKNDYRKRQYQNLLAGFLDSNGLVKKWQGQLGQSFTLYSSNSDAYGLKARNSMNVILGSLVGSIESGNADLSTIEGKKQYLGMIAGADEASTYGSGYDKVRGQRQINAGYAMAAFESNSSLADQLKKTILAAGAAEQFSALKGFGAVTSYESYAIVNAVNQLLTSGAISNNSHASFYARIFVDKALAAMNFRDVPGFQAAIEGIQSLTDLKKGISEGVLIGAIDTVEGLWTLATHPIDSAVALYTAVVNYDKTFAAVAGLVTQTIAEMPNWDAQKWGQFEGRVAFEVGSALVGAKIFDSAGDVSRLTNLSLGIEEAGARVAGASEKALSLGLSSADDMTEFVSSSVRLGITEEADYSRLGNVIRGSHEGWEQAISADAHLIGQGDRLSVAAKWYTKADGTFDVIVHGTPDSFAVLHNGNWEYLSHRDMATFIGKNGWDGKTPIRLMSCSTGACETGAAKNLANKLGVTVEAPNNTLWFHSDGKLTIGPDAATNSGSWITFTPGK